jgi:hypothetical protein
MSPELLKYIQSQSRNKIVFFKNDIPNIKPLDVGSNLAMEIKPLLAESKVGMKSKFIIDELFSKSIEENELYGKYLALSNLGILFEPELKIDFANMLSRYSSTNTLFVQWEGEKDNETLYFLTKEKGQKINIKNLSHIVI